MLSHKKIYEGKSTDTLWTNTEVLEVSPDAFSKINRNVNFFAL